MKSTLFILFLLISQGLYSQTDEDYRIHDSLEVLNDAPGKKKYTFIVYETLNAVKTEYSYTCEVRSDTIVEMSRSYFEIETKQSGKDTTFYFDNVILYNRKLLEYHHNVDLAWGEHASGHAWFNYGKLYYNFTDGHHLGGNDGWDGQEAAEHVLEEMLKHVRKKHPKWNK